MKREAHYQSMVIINNNFKLLVFTMNRAQKVGREMWQPSNSCDAMPTDPCNIFHMRRAVLLAMSNIISIFFT